MPVAIITGSAGLVGSAAAAFFCRKGYTVIGIDNDLRSYFFGRDASTRWKRDALLSDHANYHHHDLDIRDRAAVESLFSEYNSDIELVIHTASQPSHDWAAREPETDFTVNANGTLVFLEATRRFSPNAVFIFTSTNKVYGDTPNRLPLVELDTRWEIEDGHQYSNGIDESMSIDSTKHSLFGASKVAADVLVQEYGRYFGMRTACFRAGCITGADHSGAELHGFLSYLMKCTIAGTPYTVFGYQAKQVRDNIHADDLVCAFYHVSRAPRAGEVYNIGGSRFSNCSVLEAIQRCEQIAGKRLAWTYSDQARSGDHIWWVSGISKFQSHYPGWRLQHGVDDILLQIFENSRARWV
jgi:CDP-paratose 2-epimerase